MSGIEFMFACIVWYGLGLIGSHLSIMSSKYLSWDSVKSTGFCMAFLGPVQLFVGIFMIFMSED